MNFMSFTKFDGLQVVHICTFAYLGVSLTLHTEK